MTTQKPTRDQMQAEGKRLRQELDTTIAEFREWYATTPISKETEAIRREMDETLKFLGLPKIADHPDRIRRKRIFSKEEMKNMTGKEKADLQRRLTENLKALNTMIEQIEREQARI